MLSLSNSYNIGDVADFINRAKKTIDEAMEYVLELKLDGLSISVIYEKGRLVQAVTRGDGVIGEDVTENIMEIASIPHYLKERVDVEVRGEIVLPIEKFESLNKRRLENGEEVFANPRNAASGTIRQLDASIVKDRYSDDKRLLNYMDSIINDSNRVLELSSQIVDYAEEKNMIYAFIEDNIKNTIEEVLEEFREQIELEDLMIFRPLGDLFLVFDKSKIKRVFKHIIKNSLENIDYEKDEHYLKISFEKNKFGASTIVFLDNGVGVAEESIQNIFEPLVSGKIQGTGLGLPISKNIVEKHNWDLKFESVKYNYTKVTIMTK
jgi:signal transduction histidine kinase